MRNVPAATQPPVTTTEAGADTMDFVRSIGMAGFVQRPGGSPPAGQSLETVSTATPPPVPATEGDAADVADIMTRITQMGIPGFRVTAGPSPASVSTTAPPRAAAAEETAASGADIMTRITQMGIPGFRPAAAGTPVGQSPAPVITAAPPAAPAPADQVRPPISPAAAPSGSLTKGMQSVADGISAATADLNAGRISPNVYRQKITAFLHSGKI